MANLQLAEKDVVTEREVILEERRSRTENNPSNILSEQMSAALYRNHPYRIPIIGWMHEMAKLSRADALSFYKRFYAPNNAVMVVDRRRHRRGGQKAGRGDVRRRSRPTRRCTRECARRSRRTAPPGA